MKVFSQAEWKRLNDQIHCDAEELKRIEEKRRANEEVKSNSKEMVKNWTNTFLVAK